MTDTLKGQILRHRDYEHFEAQIADLFWDLVFKPIVELLKDESPKEAAKSLPKPGIEPQKALENALENANEDALKKALKSGRVQMNTDPKTGKAVFSGAFNRSIADIIRSFGGEFDKRGNVYKCDMAKVPAWVRADAAGYHTKAQQVHEEIKKRLGKMSEGFDSAVKGAKLTAARKAVDAVEAGWKDSAKTLEVVPGLDENGRQLMADAIEESAKIPIKEWMQTAVDKMRQQVEDNALHGYRMESLASRIRSEYGTTQAKARQIARQETSNFMSDFRASRAKEVGCKRYLWDASMDERTRPDHKKLHGQVFFYDSPPIVDSKTGRRANPGKDFGCRCQVLPVLDPIGATK